MTKLGTPDRPLRIFLSTGEVSGDLQGALLIQALQRAAAARGQVLEITALGGPRMAAAGARLIFDTSAIGSIGLWEALPFVIPTLKLQWQTKATLRQQPPDVAVFIDYIGPNLTMGHFFKRQLPQVPTAYYIAPQEWVWSLGDRNTTQVVGLTDVILAIFPQEATYYQRYGAAVKWIGHPLIDRLAQAPDRATARQHWGLSADELAVVLLPASRRQELKLLMPSLFAAARQVQDHHPKARFLIPVSLPAYRPAIEQAIAEFGLQAEIVGDSLLAMAAADLALTKSGTVNLELALLKVPQVVIYKVSPITAWIARHLLKFSITFMSPPNLVAEQAIVPELMQEQASPDRIAQEAIALLQPDRAAQLQQDYQAMRDRLGGDGATDRAAQEILNLI
ncbi:lipid-A-disaccharide synthase [Limnothrix sp. FACHB-1083]|uniref:lipid-A-disaccharide synthase n=1 Tax=unclassified Limnothrix TaxID=2632864 RepID=UPI0016814B6E|nr:MULTISPECIES: lipid-A-disaccharide synthase [unclassified Limnothrix]MBD2160620.1 lipid-A-disaccharide synthase [Limnothrix sp. FACHB-1083]MBD2191536.1 lipid-A-disaccharide synthase [Limnothrix sp. FACHB-1088]